MPAQRVVLQLQSETFAHRYQLASMAVTAAASGDEVWVVLWFDALLRWVEGRFDDAVSEADEGFARAHGQLGLPPPSQMLEEARSLGAKIVACETGIRMAGLDPDKLGGRLDDRPGLPEILEAAKGAALTLYL